MCTITWELVLPGDEDKRMEAEDGTTFFRSRSQLYTFVDGTRLEVDLPLEFHLQPRGTVGNALYFYAKVEVKSSGLSGLIGNTTETHVFFKTSILPGELKLERVNEIALADSVEILPEQPFYSVRKDTQLTVYRFEEKEKIDRGRIFDISGADPEQTKYRLMWRDKLILTQTWQCAEISKLSEEVLLLRIPFHVMGSFIHDDHHLLYLLYHSKRYCLFVDLENLAIHRVENDYNPPQKNNAQFGFAPTDIVHVKGDTILYTTAPVMEPRNNWRGKIPAQYLKK